jgi:hypothetical protein
MENIEDVKSRADEVKQLLASIDDLVKTVDELMQDCCRQLGITIPKEPKSHPIYNSTVSHIAYIFPHIKSKSEDLRREISLLNSLQLSGYGDYPFKYQDEKGYIILLNKDLTWSKSEHRYVIEKHLQRELSQYEFVHHKDENKSNNKLDNLQVMTPGDHARYHIAKRQDMIMQAQGKAKLREAFQKSDENMGKNLDEAHLQFNKAMNEKGTGDYVTTGQVQAYRRKAQASTQEAQAHA